MMRKSTNHKYEYSRIINHIISLELIRNIIFCALFRLCPFFDSFNFGHYIWILACINFPVMYLFDQLAYKWLTPYVLILSLRRLPLILSELFRSHLGPPPFELLPLGDDLCVYILQVLQDESVVLIGHRLQQRVLVLLVQVVAQEVDHQQTHVVHVPH
jgi:hypothetical protein